MSRKSLLGILVASACMAATAPSAWALPPDRTMQYTIYQTRSDRNSAVEFVVVLELSAKEAKGNSVGWVVNTAQFERHLGSTMVWIKNAPAVDSSDGLWWITHADPNNPVNSEFHVPPHMSGTAGPQSGASGDLSYDFTGVTYTPPAPPGQPPFGEKTGVAEFIFIPPDPTPPTGTDDDEIVEIDHRA